MPRPNPKRISNSNRKMVWAILKIKFSVLFLIIKVMHVDYIWEIQKKRGKSPPITR